MKIGVKPMGRVYTYPEVRELLKEQDVIRDARLYDEKPTDMYLHLETLRRMGFQRKALENFIFGVAELSEEINAGKLDYHDMEAGMDDYLGYHLRDEGLYEELKERALK